MEYQRERVAAVVLRALSCPVEQSLGLFKTFRMNR